MFAKHDAEAGVNAVCGAELKRAKRACFWMQNKDVSALMEMWVLL